MYIHYTIQVSPKFLIMLALERGFVINLPLKSTMITFVEDA